MERYQQLREGIQMIDKDKLDWIDEQMPLLQDEVEDIFDGDIDICDQIDINDNLQSINQKKSSKQARDHWDKMAQSDREKAARDLEKEELEAKSNTAKQREENMSGHMQRMSMRTQEVRNDIDALKEQFKDCQFVRLDEWDPTTCTLRMCIHNYSFSLKYSIQQQTYSLVNSDLFDYVQGCIVNEYVQNYTKLIDVVKAIYWYKRNYQFDSMDHDEYETAQSIGLLDSL